MAFIVVVAAITVVMAVLAATLFRVALDNVSTSARMVTQNQALQAAEAGVDVAYQAIEATTLASPTSHLPCGPFTGGLGSGPSRSTYAVRVKYYAYTSVTHPTPTQVSAVSTATCPAAKPLTIVRVAITATGKDLSQTAKVVSRANIAPVNPLADSIFVTGSMTLQGSNSATGRKLYLHRGTLTCTGHGKIDGSVTVIGKVTASGNCTIVGSVEATTSISISSSAKIDGTVISTTGSITVTVSVTSIKGSMYARDSITTPSSAWNSQFTSAHTVTGTTVQYTINPTETALTPPTEEAWPTLTWTTFKWATMKYKSFSTVPCTKLTTDILLAKTATPNYTGIAIKTSCTVTFKAVTGSLVLAQSLAVFSTGNIKVSQNATITDAQPADRKTLLLIVPNGATCGSKGNITIHGTIGTGVATLVYSPCKVTIQGSSPIKEGEVYSKTLTMNGNMTLGTATFTFKGISATRIGVGIAYERQVS